MTPLRPRRRQEPLHFNPHEREARDAAQEAIKQLQRNFNPHEREARDPDRHGDNLKRRYFNPHEREARDLKQATPSHAPEEILIHTSVKLVTRRECRRSYAYRILIHTSVKLVTPRQVLQRSVPAVF